MQDIRGLPLRVAAPAACRRFRRGTRRQRQSGRQKPQDQPMRSQPRRDAPGSPPETGGNCDAPRLPGRTNTAQTRSTHAQNGACTAASYPFLADCAGQKGRLNFPYPPRAVEFPIPGLVAWLPKWLYSTAVVLVAAESMCAFAKTRDQGWFPEKATWFARNSGSASDRGAQRAAESYGRIRWVVHRLRQRFRVVELSTLRPGYTVRNMQRGRRCDSMASVPGAAGSAPSGGDCAFDADRSRSNAATANMALNLCRSARMRSFSKTPEGMRSARLRRYFFVPAGFAGRSLLVAARRCPFADPGDRFSFRSSFPLLMYACGIRTTFNRYTTDCNTQAPSLAQCRG